MVGLGDHVNQARITMIEAGRLQLSLLNQVQDLTPPARLDQWCAAAHPAMP